MNIKYKKYRKLYKYKLINPFSIEIDWLKEKYWPKYEWLIGNESTIKNSEHMTPFNFLIVSTDYIKIHKKDGILELEKNYAWDGPSGPAIDTKNFMRSSLVHDALYQLMAIGILSNSYRKKADEEMRRISLEDGMSKFRAWYTYLAVRLFGAFYARPKSAKVLIAP